MSDVLADNAGLVSAAPNVRMRRRARVFVCVYVRVCVCAAVCSALLTAPVSTATAATLRDAVVCGARSTRAMINERRK